MKRWLLVGAAMMVAGAAPLRPAERGTDRGPIIDMHLHAEGATDQGPLPNIVCAPYDTMPTRDPRWSAERYGRETFGTPICRHPIAAAPDDDALRERSLAMLARYDITAVTSGTAAMVDTWRKAAPDRIIPALAFDGSAWPTIAELRRLRAAGHLAVLGEIGTQYDGIAPDDARLEPYYALAEELDVPVAIHMGPGPPGAAYLGSAYRARLTDPLGLEEVLIRHPRLRLYVMHAGWPMADRMIALLYAHPQIYVDVAVIDYTQPRAEFWAYLKRLVDAGYGRRIMFGSDQMVWPDAIPVAIAAIREAPFLSAAQKRDILHDNAARFLRLGER